MGHATEETPLSAAELLPSVVMHEELSWFFAPALSAIELPSTYEAMLRRARVGKAKRVALTRLDESAERSVDARRAARAIHGWLMRLSPMDRDLLAAVYTADDTWEAMMDLPDANVARALRAYERTRRGNSVVPHWEEE
jgi:hypothetical protein